MSLLDEQYPHQVKSSKFALKPIKICHTTDELIKCLTSEFHSLPKYRKMRSPWISRESAEWRTTDAWLFRERVLCYCLKFVTVFLKKYTKKSAQLSDIIEILPGTERIVPRGFHMSKHYPLFTILGSAALESDIDITIQGDHAIFIISILEDLFDVIDSHVPI